MGGGGGGEGGGGGGGGGGGACKQNALSVRCENADGLIILAVYKFSILFNSLKYC